MSLFFNPTPAFSGGGRGVSEDGYSGANKFASNLKTVLTGAYDAGQAAAAGGAAHHATQWPGFEFHSAANQAAMAVPADQLPNMQIFDNKSMVAAGGDHGIHSAIKAATDGASTVVTQIIGKMGQMLACMGNPMSFINMIFDFLQAVFNPANFTDWMTNPAFIHQMAGAAQDAALEPFKKLYCNLN